MLFPAHLFNQIKIFEISANLHNNWGYHDCVSLLSLASQIGQSIIQESTKWNLWKAAIKKFHSIYSWNNLPQTPVLVTALDILYFSYFCQ